MKGIQLMNTYDLDRGQIFDQSKKKKYLRFLKMIKYKTKLLTSIHNIYKTYWIAVLVAWQPCQCIIHQVAALFIVLHYFYLSQNDDISSSSVTINKCLTLRSLTLYIYGAPILDVSRSHTTTQHSR